MSIVRFVFLCTLYSALCTLLLGACDDVGATVTPTTTLTGPTIEPSATFRAQLPGDYVPDAFVGISDPTAAALAPGAAMPPLGLPGSAPNGDQQSVEVTADDGTQLVGDLYMSMALRQPGVVLFAPDRTAWGSFPATVHAAGFTVLVLGMRDDNQTQDLEAAIQSLSQSASPDHLGVIGAGEGADAGLLGCAGEGLCKALVLLSPSDASGLVDAVGRYNPRPLFLAATQEDTPSFNGISAIQGAATGAVFFQPFSKAGFGTALIENRPDLGTLIVEWLQQNLA
ncbi:MAG: hypothetical protein ABI690_24600 [Chloroflexota bacterium]